MSKVATDFQTEWGPRQTNGVTWKWLVGVLLTLALAIGGWVFVSLVDRVKEIELSNNARAERLVTVEAETRLLKEQLTRIEHKLDAVLDRRP